MTVRVDVAPSVASWALDVTGADENGLHRRFKIDQWLAAESRPTLKQLQDFAKATGVPFGYLLLPQPPAWTLPVPDFREGFRGWAPAPQTVQARHRPRSPNRIARRRSASTARLRPVTHAYS